MQPDAPVIAGRYVLVRPLGEVLHLAHDRRDGRPVFLFAAVPPPELGEAARAEIAERTVAAARAAQQLRHPGVNAVLVVVRHDGCPWVVTAAVDGRPLPEVVARTGPLAPRAAARLAADLLGALAHAHALGVRHGDVQPGNVWLTPDGRGVLTGFGTVPDGGAGGAGGVSRIGAPGFAAPEAEPVPAGDLFSVGATVYLAVEGVPPFSGDSPMAVLSAVLSADPRAPARAGDLGPVLLALLAKDPAHRPRDAVETLERVAGGARTGRRITVGRGRLAVLAGSLAVALVSATTIATVLLTSPDSPDAAVRTGSAPQAVADDEPGKFAAPPRACGLLTDDQVAQLVPSGYKDRGLRGGRGDPDAACWIDAASLDDTAPTVKINVVRHAPGPLGGGPAMAREFVSALRAEAAAGPTVLGDTVSNLREPAGQGDAAVVYDVRPQIGRRVQTVAAVAVSNVVAVVRCESDIAADPGPQTVEDVSTCAEKATGWVAEALERAR